VAVRHPRHFAAQGHVGEAPSLAAVEADLADGQAAGPVAKTTISAIAEMAGVTRVTVHEAAIDRREARRAC
jgi:hypothetical protein